MAAQNLNKVFIGSIAGNIEEDDIKRESSKFGTVEGIYYSRDSSQNNKGWAFVTFSKSEEADSAIAGMNGKQVFANSMQPIEARIAAQKQKTGNFMNAGISSNGWIMYRTPDGHPYYHNAHLNVTTWEMPTDFQINNLPIGNHQNSQGASNQPFGPPGANLFIFHVPNEWTDADVRANFAPYGTILSARIQKDNMGRNKGYGFVSYDNAQSAIAAISQMSGKQVGSKWLKVQLKKGEEHFAQSSQQPLLHHQNLPAGAQHHISPNQASLVYRPAPFFAGNHAAANAFGAPVYNGVPAAMNTGAFPPHFMPTFANPMMVAAAAQQQAAQQQQQQQDGQTQPQPNATGQFEQY